MFCTKCGKELNDGSLFCPKCGTKVSSFGIESVSDVNNKAVINSDNNSSISKISGNNGFGMPDEQSAHTGNISVQHIQYSERNHSQNGGERVQPATQQRLFNKLWNNEIFTNLAIRFDHMCEWVLIPAKLILAFIFFDEGGFWGVIFGSLFLLLSISSVVRIISRFKKRKAYFIQNRTCPTCGKESTTSGFCNNCGAQMPQLSARDLEDENGLSDSSLKDKKKKLLWAPLVIAIGILIVSSGALSSLTGSDPIENTKRITLDGYSHSIGTWVSSNIKNGKWNKEKIDSDSYYVTVEGYCADISEDILIKFRYEDLGESCQVKVMSIALPESDEVYTDSFSMAIVFGYLDD